MRHLGVNLETSLPCPHFETGMSSHLSIQVLQGQSILFPLILLEQEQFFCTEQADSLIQGFKRMNTQQALKQPV